MTPTFGSLFAGVGGFDLGFETAGFECRFQVEWDQHCQQTLAHHWPNVPRWADVSDVNGAHLPPVDVITYGFPCQDLSVAGKRAGLDGNRSHLFFEAVRIITEMRQATNGRYPTWAVAENVAGLLNADNGTAMGRVIDELAAAGAVVIEWATLDAQWFGVPQRRRRVFIAACFNPATGDRCPDPLFPVAPGSSRNPATRRQTGEDIAGTLGCRSHSAGSTDLDGHGAYIPFRRVSSGEWVDDDTGATLTARDHKDHGDLIATPIGFVAEEHEHGVVFGSSSIGGYSEGIGTLRAGNSYANVVVPDTNPIGFSHTQGIDPQPSTEHFPTLRGEGGGHAVAQAIPMQDGRDIDKQQNGLGIGEPGDPMYTLDTTGAQSVAVDTYNQTTDDNTFQTMRGSRPDHVPHVVAPSLTASNNPSRSPQSTEVTQQIEAIHQAQPDLAVRRLTPLECERLMGWPDDHTLHRADGKTNADSTRYKMCGNGVAAPVAAWIAKHLRNTLR